MLTQIRVISVARLHNLGLHNLCFCVFGNAPLIHVEQKTQGKGSIQNAVLID